LPRLSWRTIFPTASTRSASSSARKGGNRSALGWLLVDASAPVLGALTTLAVIYRKASSARPRALRRLFIYISAADLLPESYHDHPTGWTTQ